MSKVNTDYSTTPELNVQLADASLREGETRFKDVNNIFRQIMADVREDSDEIRGLISAESTARQTADGTATDAIAGKVGLTGDESIAGVKTFGASPLVPDPSDMASQQAASAIWVRDMLRARVEAASGGRNTIVRDVYDVPHVMVVLPKFLLSDIVATWPSEPHQAFVVGGAVKSEILIGKYLASQSSAGHVLTMAHKEPWASINFDNSLARCRELGSGFGLVTNAMWAAYALYLWKLFGGADSGSHVYHGNSNYGRDYSDHFQHGTLKNGAWNHGDTSLSDAATLTGSGPVEWSADETPWGVCDLTGNVWEWVAGLRLSDGEIQILPNNDAILSTADMGASSTQWRAILGDPASEDDGLGDPGDEGTFKYDGSVADTKTSFVNAGAFRLNTELVNQNDKGFYQNANFSGLVVATGVTAPEMLKQLALFPIGSGAVQGTVFACNKGERLASRGGAWGAGLGAGPFALHVHYPRTPATRSFGFRAGFVS
jgi:hypothetical protein